ncbi:enoyl-CoA hydratase [candidate division KSB1 bacterium]|nr:enoyl-CoA hydratase [candidate division KSB1 bacterium]
MELQNVKFTVEDRVALIVIDHPPANALDTPTMEDLDKCIDEVANNDEIKAAVLTGAGMFFIAGADINEINTLKTVQDGEDICSKGQGIINKLEKLRKPVIAAINGMCLGGGNELAMACHLRIASDRARFGQPEINLGIMPGFGGTQRLPRIVGRAKAAEMILTGDMITAQEAYRIGLVNKVVPGMEVVKQAQGIAKRIAAKGAVAIARVMEAIEEGLKVSLEEGLKMEAHLFGLICETEDMREGIGAFIQKRQPKFQDK